ncbi:class D sortase [Clostridium botulinum]|uniref:Sortase family protein n=2 Tax=Clostridium botulinum TaxID=1491 RepID=A0A3F2ZVV5_CLOB6|nr:class D sortase [Clostridium botulinum]ACQ52366.1 sortase family protein [Clostridium botulinum Ba4 str. 657]AJE12752.1 sortase family protein [Clostridium botulinum CDC_1436]EDT85014.1 sortase family protein [Clostridium botulinum Bf]MBY6757170.1 class D sortase [Clostridium botulinum]MBY6879467.1 class D sortase [Clostridium botulinum]
MYLKSVISMSKFKLSFKKLSLVKILSLGTIVLGLGCISWSLINIWSQPKNSYNEATDNVEYLSKLDSYDKSTVIYEVNPEKGDDFGSIIMPTLKQKFPIIQGTDDKELKKGVGHFLESALPGEEDNCVLSGHRDTVFSQIGKLKIGDPLIVQTSAGIFTYRVSETRIVKKDDKTVIVPADNAKLTMTTCYPFYFIGYAPERYIVFANLVKNK